MNQRITAIITALIALSGMILFFWLVPRFAGESAMNEPAKLLCRPSKTEKGKEECFLTAHVHADIKIFKNGKEIDLEYEFGNLDRNHIHSQKNILHWHGLIKIDKKPDTLLSFEELAQFKEFQLSYILPDLNFTPKKEPKFILNGNQVDGSQTWKAGDSIEIYYE